MSSLRNITKVIIKVYITEYQNMCILSRLAILPLLYHNLKQLSKIGRMKAKSVNLLETRVGNIIEMVSIFKMQNIWIKIQ